MKPPRQQEDAFRDSMLRYVAFTSDLGESFKPFITRRLYLGSYAIVALYGLADTLDKGHRAYRQAAATQLPTMPVPVLAAADVAVVAAVPTACRPSPPLPHPSLLSCFALHQSATRAAAMACAACRPPAAVYHAPSSISERRAVAVPVAAAVLDTALWHAAASLAIPAVAINRAVWATGLLLSRGPWSTCLHPCVLQLAPSAAGLALIPLLVPCIDEVVTEWMDEHLRPHLLHKASCCCCH